MTAREAAVQRALRFCATSEEANGGYPLTLETVISVAVDMAFSELGATPHTPTSTVTDAEVEAAAEAFRWSEKHGGGSLLAALEAAAVVRDAEEDDR